jgi:3-oxoadipate enol-lactonase
VNAEPVTSEPDRSAQVRGVELAYERAGTGADVIWGHGLTSSIASEDELGLVDWSVVRRAATVVRYDARGHGRSGSTTDVADYQWRSLALDQFALADHLGIGRYVSAGASMGGATALHAAVLAPERIAALVLAIPPTGWASRAAQAGSYLASAELLEAGETETLLAGLSQRPTPDPFASDPRWDERFVRTVTESDPVRLARVFRGAAATDLPDPPAIASIDVPVLILAWTGDAGHPVQTAARLQELMPHAELALASTPAGLASWTGRIERFVRAVG